MGANLQAVHPVLGATDVEELVRFYDRLGFAVVFRDAPIDPKYAAVRRDGVELHIQWADKGLKSELSPGRRQRRLLRRRLFQRLPATPRRRC
jgi:catechol 2,3-dioxygenase-like lactoylglutathione lyase family enzyme